MFENNEKALIIMLLATGVILDGEDEQVQKRKKRSVWMKPCLKNRLRSSAYENIFQELRLKKKRNTDLTRNIVMAAPIIMNSTLDNARVLDPLLKFIFKN